VAKTWPNLVGVYVTNVKFTPKKREKRISRSMNFMKFSNAKFSRSRFSRFAFRVFKLQNVKIIFVSRSELHNAKNVKMYVYHIESCKIK
jgi:hypothetical protein